MFAGKMADSSSINILISVGILLLAFVNVSYSSGLKIRTSTFRSPKFELGPGFVENKYYFNIKFLRGHKAIKSFTGEVIDEAGNPIPLYETYLHHWSVERYYHRKINSSNPQSDYITGRNNGICQGDVLGQLFGIGAESRRIATYVPDPYGIEIGNPAQIPEGFEERWVLNVHAIDTRGVEDRFGCTQCRCELYNGTKLGPVGQPLSPNYKGGLFCCPDQSQCKLRKDAHGRKRSLYLRFKVHWVDWDSSIIPVKVFLLDVTDDGIRHPNVSPLSYDLTYGCKVEFDVQACQANNGTTGDGCIDARRTSIVMPNGGYVVYALAHQHRGGNGSALYRQDGSVICKSVPTYGKGKEPGNEAGYLVKMSACYPKIGSVKIANGEKLTLESNYTETARTTTGVMGLFHLLLADRLPNPVQISRHGHLSTKA